MIGGMPQENRRQLLQLLVLLLALPLQYWLSRSSSEVWRQYEIKQVLTRLTDFSTHYLAIDGWVNWCSQLWDQLSRHDGDPDASVPVGTAALGNNGAGAKNGHFATSDKPRSPRPPHIRYRIGQVIVHKKWKYRGVIIGWDATVNAPQNWIDQMWPKDKLEEWKDLPNYSILIDTRDRLTPQLAYLIEDNIDIVTHTRIFHPLVDHYFEAFDGERYVARPLLKKTYPHD